MGNGAYDRPRFLPAGDAALTVELGDAVDAVVNRRVLEFDRRVRAAAIPGLLESVPTYRSLFVQYDPGLAAFAGLVEALGPLVPAEDVPAEGRRWLFPVCYGGEFGADLEFVAETHGLTPEAVVDIHLSAEYRVYMIGFAPGFAYMGGLPAALHTPRRASPRLRIPANSVALGGIQAGITSIPVPSGWHLLGRTPAQMFDLGRGDDAFLLAAGDVVRFERIDAATFAALEAAGGLIARRVG
ncbi:KipI family sensor histidine kinase inhibitor [Stella humosa]|uniref:KipI family sensor histidine kinase inhibitor n=1 Tax=Stella humosa TaxID=94 RepID=A0A3N1MFK3_9PROT|nr:5-oxoprolinase subunit PxpB [Stella humosa]ROQ01450.1 KipI family sensor histidine kinase inhibitor [Stella humosa]BBK31826.1 allophanate hydrolase [Stella humosa]